MMREYIGRYSYFDNGEEVFLVVIVMGDSEEEALLNLRSYVKFCNGRRVTGAAGNLF